MATRSLVSAMWDWSSWKENISLNTGLRVLDLYAVFFCPSSYLQEKEYALNIYIYIYIYIYRKLIYAEDHLSSKYRVAL